METASGVRFPVKDDPFCVERNVESAHDPAFHPVGEQVGDFSRSQVQNTEVRSEKTASVDEIRIVVRGLEGRALYENDPLDAEFVHDFSGSFPVKLFRSRKRDSAFTQKRAFRDRGRKWCAILAVGIPLNFRRISSRLTHFRRISSRLTHFRRILFCRVNR